MKVPMLLVLLIACGDPPKYTVARLEDPGTCKDCHPKHYQQWSGSMHAYASDDPVFVAMNKRGQREAQLGSFCLQCHAPMAVALHPDQDFSTLDPTMLPPEEKGITCFFCHDVDSIKADHNNGLVLALDDTMRGGAKNPADTPAHNSNDDTTLMASKSNKSTMCGSCHDVTTPAPHNVALERTYSEWQTTIFAHDDPTNLLPVTCSNCHMTPSTDVIADNPNLNVGARTDGFHDHTWPAIDQALTTFHEADAQAAGIMAILDPSLAIVGPRPIAGGTPPGGICLDPPGTLSIRIDTFSTGHMFPSGAAQDRRSWLEVIAYRADNSIAFSSGVVSDGMDPEDINDDKINCTGTGLTDCSGFWDRIYKDDNTPAHFFWEAARVDSHLLKPQITLSPADPGFDHSTTVTFNVGALISEIDHITARLRIRPLSYAVLAELVASGDLDPSIPAGLKTLQSAGATKTWTKATKGTGSALNTNCNPGN